MAAPLPQLVFVSVDPQRDDHDRLSAYLHGFGSEIVGLTGAPGSLHRFAADVGASYRVPADARGAYAMDHSTSVFLVDPNAQVVGTFLRPSDAALVSADFRRVASPKLSLGIRATDAWIRGGDSGGRGRAGFLRLHNDGSRERRLVSVSSPQFDDAQIHQTVIDGDMARMRSVRSIVIPASGRTTLAPGGYHLMLIDARETLHIGDIVALVLRFEDGLSLDVRALVRALPSR